MTDKESSLTAASTADTATIATLREALEAAQDALRRASRILTEEHRLALGGKAWGGLVLETIDVALANTENGAGGSTNG